jgi:hypothetical protein
MFKCVDVLQVSLVRNRLPEDDRSSDDDTEAPQQQQQQQAKKQVQSLEILDFRVHAAAGYLAVAVRRQAVCAVEIYKLRSSSSSSGGGAAPGADAEPKIDADAAEVTVPVVLLVTNSSSSSSINGNATAAAAAAGPDTITVANPAGAAGIAELAWVLALDDATLVLELEGLEGPAAEPWLAVHVSGITTPSALYYVQLNTRQQVKVSNMLICDRRPMVLWPIKEGVLCCRCCCCCWRCCYL